MWCSPMNPARRNTTCRLILLRMETQAKRPPIAAQNGVRAHHWPYGDMPPQPHVSAGDLKAIVTYIRALQQANGFGS